MAYTKRPTGGTKLQRCTGTNVDWLGPWQDIPGLTGTINLPGGTPTKVDITTHDDVASLGRFKQNGAGLSDVPDPGATLLFDPDDSVCQALQADFAAGTVRQYRIVFPNVTRKWGVEGQVGLGQGSAPIDGYLQVPFSVVANKINFNVA